MTSEAAHRSTRLHFDIEQIAFAVILVFWLIIAAHPARRALLVGQCGGINAPALLHYVAVRDRCAEIGGRAASFLFAWRVLVHTRRWFDA